MSRRRPSWSVLTGFVVSLLVHLGALVPLLVLVMTTRQARPVLRARFDPEHFRQSPEEEEELPDEEELKLGIDEGKPSSLTWIGYETYQEHLAQLAEFDQAAFTDAETEAELSGAQPAPDTAEATDPSAAEASASQEEPAAERDAEEAQRDPDPDAQRSAAIGAADDPATAGAIAEPEIAAGETGAPAEEAAALPPSDDTAEPIVAAADAPDVGEPTAGAPDADAARSSAPDPSPLAASLVRRMLEQVQRAPSRSEGEEAARENPQPSETPQPAEVAAATPPPEVSTPGDPGDRESDPTSTVDVPMDRIKAGRPVAARGLEILPRRPDFTMVTMLTASPCNPLVAIHFRRDGRPKLASILETSCDPRVDDAVLSSLYRWRARGKPLAALSGSDTYEIRIRIILSRR